MKSLAELQKEFDELAESANPVEPTQKGEYQYLLGADAVGQRIKVKWSRNNWYSGTITAFSGLEHVITYDDGDVKAHDLKQKSFKLI